jgi:hypothetical protein
MGLHTGRMVAGGLGEVLVGDAVTRAMALQAQAAPGTILCSEATACLVQGVVRLEKVGLLPVAVKPIPVTAYTVLGHRSRRRPLAHGERRVWTPFIGRRRELKTLHMLLAQVEAGQGQVVGVMGEPGIGKSRLVYEFQHCLRERPVTYLSASCVSHAAAPPYLPLLVLLRQNCGLTEGNSQTAIAAKVRMSLEEVGLEPEHWAPYLLELLEVPAEMDRLATVNMKAVKARTVEAFVQLALHGARRRPLVLEVENLHWMDPTSEEVVAALVERLVGARILLLLTYRPGYRPPWVDKSYATQLALAPLAPRDSRRLPGHHPHDAGVRGGDAGHPGAR